MTLRERLERLLRYALLAFVLAAAAFLSAITTIRVSIRGRVVTMPNVVGKPLAEAQTILQAGGLQIRVADRMYNSLPLNAVVRQSPAPGEQVKLSQTAHVVLSLGPQTISVPAVEGRSLRGARITLLESGLELGEVSRAYLAVPQADTVLAQDPPQGASATSPRVDVLVAAGGRPVEYVMPTLTGLDQVGAERVLAAAGLRGTRVTFVTESGSAAGTVIGQTPPRGSRFSGEGPVEISVAQ
jgi:eukaryotic-like serine/threonine-protein kinase